MVGPADFDLTFQYTGRTWTPRFYWVAGLVALIVLVSVVYVGTGQLTAAGSAVILFVLVAPVAAVLVRAFLAAVATLLK